MFEEGVIYNSDLKIKIRRANQVKAHKLNKGVWGMPRLSEAKKDATSCEKLRGEAHTL